MSDSIATATSLLAMSSASTRQAIATEMVRQNAQADASVVQLLQQGADQAKAVLPPGQGAQVDRFA
jgi:hypothetical protein